MLLHMRAISSAVERRLRIRRNEHIECLAVSGSGCARPTHFDPIAQSAGAQGVSLGAATGDSGSIAEEL